MKIIVFDSGFGSLSIIKEIRRNIRSELIYFADQTNFPYGKKPIPKLKRIIDRTIKELEKKFHPDIIIVGSNTPSILLKNFKQSNLIGIFPPLEKASKSTKTNSIAILSTQNVIKSKALNDLITRNIPKKINVLKINASPLVQLVESGKFIEQKDLCINKIRKLLYAPITKNKVDLVTLSSTHLPFLLPFFKQIFPKIVFLDPAKDIVQLIKKKQFKEKKNSFKIYTSGNVLRFQDQLKKIGVNRRVKSLKIN